jgi:phosphorylase/glycogen(starch) synthase
MKKKYGVFANQLRSRLINRILQDFSSTVQAPSCYSPQDVVSIRAILRKDILTIGFARRFATYKRAHLLFSNPDRLDAIINNPDMPVQFLFAGKAHPDDKAGQDLIKRIIEISRMPQFLGKILFIPTTIWRWPRRLCNGVDVWMNTPTRPLEASGTSGEKAAMNGVMHFMLYWTDCGLKATVRSVPAGHCPRKELTKTSNNQDEMDAATIYNLLETEIVPLFYKRNALGIPEGWYRHIKNTVAFVAGKSLSTNRHDVRLRKNNITSR